VAVDFLAPHDQEDHIVVTPARKIWRRAKLQVADDVRTRLDGDIVDLHKRLDAIEAQLAGLHETLGIVRDAIDAQVDMETESNELLGRMLSRLAGSLERLDVADDLAGRRDAGRRDTGSRDAG
jgi:hypothetical protein